MRGRLLATILAMALVLVAAASISACAAQPDASQTPQTPSAETPATTEEPAAGGSELTVGTTEGPYYVSGTAELEDGDLNASGLSGEPIRVSGHVYGGAGTTTPLSGAIVEIWHADSDGEYHPNANGDASQYSADQLALRGFVRTGEDGSYSFTSVYPGFYPGRTRHIHVRVSAEGYGAVVTQIIVPPKEGDAVTPETDNIAQSLPESYLVSFGDNNGTAETTFDFHLGAD